MRTPALFSADAVRPVLLRHTQARDADEHAHNLSQWDQRYDQLSSGAFEGSVTELWLPGSQIFVERANRRLRQTCAAWRESVWFGVPAAEDGQMALGSRKLGAEAVCVRDGGAEFELMTEADFDLYGIVVDRAAFAAHVEQHARQDLDRLLRLGDVISLPLMQKAGLCAALANILDDARCPGEEDPLALQARIFTLLTGLLQQAHGGEPPRRAQLGRQQTVQRLRELLLQDPASPPGIPELCERLHLSRRALQNCVEEVTGMAPLAFMRSIRLNAVRRELRRGGPAQSVSQVAYDWGFTHLSQFARDYRQLFGELPSESRLGGH
ncbi:helix-turn-helix domain-containing protein [Uliginosibacterium paludis]|jgi:AraC family ethanolamine operon transcriptional activator|uniref:Helix-turn-helix domain-containing protein n=1 Tax=Uliginosibacterium paludis TaxID=1615952 RepID=A0ABV2CVJ6_9RHOO